MPVVKIQALPQPLDIDVPAVIAELSIRVANAMNCPPRQVWTIWQTIEPRHYAEGVVRAAEQPHSTHPPLAEIVAYPGRSPEVIRAAIEAVARTLNEQLNLEPGNTFVTYTELTPGRVFTGGAVR